MELHGSTNKPFQRIRPCYAPLYQCSQVNRIPGLMGWRQSIPFLLWNHFTMHHYIIVAISVVLCPQDVTKYFKNLLPWKAKPTAQWQTRITWPYDVKTHCACIIADCPHSPHWYSYLGANSQGMIPIHHLKMEDKFARQTPQALSKHLGDC